MRLMLSLQEVELFQKEGYIFFYLRHQDEQERTNFMKSSMALEDRAMPFQSGTIPMQITMEKDYRIQRKSGCIPYKKKN